MGTLFHCVRQSKRAELTERISDIYMGKECQSIVATELDQYQKGVSCMQREVVVKLGCHRESSVNMENLQSLLRFQQSDDPVLVTVCELVEREAGGVESDTIVRKLYFTKGAYLESGTS
ncbi:hypothetical protein YC2023_021005 [Brassica napus]